MTTWYKLKIGKFSIIYTPLNGQEKKDYPYCDENKNILERVNESMQEEMKLKEINEEIKKDPNSKELQAKKEVIVQILNMKPYYFNPKTGEKFDKAFKLINEKPSTELKKTEETDKFVLCEPIEVENLIVDKEYLVRSEELYNELKEKNKALKVLLAFGRGHKAYRCIITPSQIYKGFCNLRAGESYKSDVVISKVEELEEREKIRELIKQLDKENKKVTPQAEDLLTL